MKYFIIRILYLSLLIIFASCSGSQESTETDTANEQEIYIFDDVSEEQDSNNVNLEDLPPLAESEPVKIDTVETLVSKPDDYIVQVGAYTTEERAQRFVMLNQSKIEWKMQITYSTRVELWVVQLPSFPTRSEAEEVRNALWLKPSFKDAFIVPEE